MWGNILDHLQQQGARVSEAKAAGRILVTYSGDPERYVDCGWIVIHEHDQFERVPAARAEASLLRRRAGEVVTLERDLTLDARMSVQVEPSGEDAIVQTDSTYVLTKRIASSEGWGLCTPRRSASGRVSRTHSLRTPDANRMASWSCLVFDALPTVSLAGG